MALILNIETATRNCSVALARDGNTISHRDHAGEGYTHAEKLHVFIEEILAESRCAMNDLDAVAVGRGPGSYTGLRIGVSAAKGFCYALGIPLISVDTLEVLARRIRVQSGFIVPMIDARRMEVYSAVFDREYNLVRETKAEILHPESYANIQGEVHLAGDCQEKVKSVLSGGNFHFHPNADFPSAREMSGVSHRKFNSAIFGDVAYFEPFYLKDFIAGKPKS